MFAVKILCVYIYIYIIIYNYNILLIIKYDLLFKVIVIINYCHIPNVAYRFQLYIYIYIYLI